MRDGAEGYHSLILYPFCTILSVGTVAEMETSNRSGLVAETPVTTTVTMVTEGPVTTASAVTRPCNRPQFRGAKVGVILALDCFGQVVTSGQFTFKLNNAKCQVRT
jgi:hypothetical protein